MRVPLLNNKRLLLIAVGAELLQLMFCSIAQCANAQLKPVPPAQPPPSALSLYRKSLSADLQYSYSGGEFLTVWRDDDLTIATATQVTHQPPDSDTITYTAPHSRKGRVILQVRNQQWTFIPQRNMLIHSTVPPDPTPPEQNAQFDLLIANYSLQVQPKTVMVAGRKTFRVDIVPRVIGRPYDRLWIDPYTGVVMRREKFHSDGTMASVSYFSDIHFKVKFPANQFSPDRWKAPAVRQVEQPTADETKVDQAHLLPPFVGRVVVPQGLLGYRLQEVTMLGSGRKASLHMLYSDGLNTLSLFESVRRGRGATRVPAARGVAIGGGKIGQLLRRYSYSILSWDTGPVNYTLIGDMNLPALIQLAQGTGTTPTPVASMRPVLARALRH